MCGNSSRSFARMPSRIVLMSPTERAGSTQASATTMSRWQRRAAKRSGVAQLDFHDLTGVLVRDRSLRNGVGQGLQPGSEPHLLQRIDAAGHEALAAELPREVGLAFEQHDLDAATRQQE